MSKKPPTLLAIDQGTTSSRALVFSMSGDPLITAQQEFTQHYPQEGWVEHDPEELWSVTLAVTREAVEKACHLGLTPSAVGITNQRETVVIWDRQTGEAIAPAIVWQDRRTKDQCNALKEAGHEPIIQQKTGLLIDPYFSATKMAWLLDHIDGARRRAERGELACGTIDSFLIWRLTNGAVHATDATNASRTSLFNIHTQDWDEELLRLFNIPRRLLPEVKDSSDDFGEVHKDHLGISLPICAVVGDQHAAAIGQACFQPGSLKATYGTGCFALMNTGSEIVPSQNRLLSTVAYRLDGKPTYALEGSIFIAGAAVQWLRDGLQLFSSSSETAERAERASVDANVVMVPAFTGMGAPYWSPDARAAIFGMTRATGPDELARAALEGVVYQTHDLLQAMVKDGVSLTSLKVDGGMASNDWFVQRLSDIVNVSIDRPKVLETTALGAAYLAGLKIGLYTSLSDIEKNWQLADQAKPQMDASHREERLARWQKCVQAVLDVADVS